jgi:hypothetical protein
MLRRAQWRRGHCSSALDLPPSIRLSGRPSAAFHYILVSSCSTPRGKITSSSFNKLNRVRLRRGINVQPELIDYVIEFGEEVLGCEDGEYFVVISGEHGFPGLPSGWTDRKGKRRDYSDCD